MLCPSTQPARTIACVHVAENHTGIQTTSGTAASQNRSPKEKTKGRVVQALELTLFQYS